MTNSLVGDHQVAVSTSMRVFYKGPTCLGLILMDHHVAVVDVDEGVLEGSDMSGTHLNGFLVKTSIGICILSRFSALLVLKAYFWKIYSELGRYF